MILNSCNFAHKPPQKTLKIHRYESAQILVSLNSLEFFCLFLVYFAAEAGIVFNLFLNFEQK